MTPLVVQIRLAGCRARGSEYRGDGLGSALKASVSVKAVEYFRLLNAVVSSQAEGGALEKEVKDTAEREKIEREFMRGQQSVLPPRSCNTSSAKLMRVVDALCPREFIYTLLRSFVGATKPIASIRSHPMHNHSGLRAHNYPHLPVSTRSRHQTTLQPT